MKTPGSSPILYLYLLFSASEAFNVVGDECHPSQLSPWRLWLPPESPTICLLFAPLPSTSSTDGSVFLKLLRPRTSKIRDESVCYKDYSALHGNDAHAVGQKAKGKGNFIPLESYWSWRRHLLWFDWLNGAKLWQSRIIGPKLINIVHFADVEYFPRQFLDPKPLTLTTPLIWPLELDFLHTNWI